MKTGNNLKILDGIVVECAPKTEHVSIPKGVKEIGSKAFCMCQELKSVEIPNGVVKIGEMAFMGCTSLTEITIPESVTEIDESAFGKCRCLATIKVSGDNPNYKDINGALYSKDGTTLLCYSSKSDDYVVPDGVTRIGMYAFASMKISSISLPNSLKEIGDYAFEDCYISSKIEIPNGVIKIGRGVFSNSYIKEIFISDSVEEIDHNTFDLCWILENIWVGKNNRYYMDIDGELYLKDGKTLVKTPEGRLPDPSEIMASDAYNWGIMFQGIDEENQMDE